MIERRTDRKTRELIDQIETHLREAERLRNHISHPQKKIWPDRRERGFTADVSDEGVNDTGETTR